MHMQDIPDMPERSPSQRSPKRNFNVITKPKYVRQIVETMFKQKSFIGKYRERRYVEPLKDYRDVIEIEVTDTIIPMLTDAKERIITAWPDIWPGFTTPADRPSVNAYCFWVSLADQLHEPYHYRIVDIVFRPAEVCFIVTAEGKVASEISDLNLEIYTNLADLWGVIQKKALQSGKAIWEILTMQNIKNTCIFLFMLFCAIAAGSKQILFDLLDRLILLIKALTPVTLKCLDIIQKVIGAFFILLYAIYRDLFARQRPYVNTREQQYIKYR